MPPPPAKQLEVGLGWGDFDIPPPRIWGFEDGRFGL